MWVPVLIVLVLAAVPFVAHFAERRMLERDTVKEAEQILD